MSDQNERACQKCGSLLHHESDCDDEGMDEIALRELVSTLLTRVKQLEGFKVEASVILDERDRLRTRIKELESRLQEAERLLRDVPWLHQTIPLHNYLEWIKARDAFLNPKDL